MKTLGLFLMAIFILTAGPAYAECIPDQDVKQVKEILTLPDDFKSEDLCNPKTDSFKLMESLLFMKNNTFHSKKVSAEFNQNILPESFWSYFISIGKQLVNKGNSGSCRNVSAFTLRALQDGIIYLCPNFYEDKKLLVERVSILLHEARHFQVADNHIACIHPLNKGTRNCDESMDARGSNAVTVESIAKMIVSKKLDAKNRAYGKFLILQYTTMAFNTPVFSNEPTAIYFIDENEQGYIYDGRNLYLAASLAQVRPISRFISLAAFPLDQSDTFTADLHSSRVVKLPASGSASESYNYVPKQNRPRMIDIIVNSEFQTLISTDQISINSMTPLPLSWTPVQVFTAQELALNEKNTYYVLDAEDKIHRISWETGSIKESVVESLPNLGFQSKAIVAFRGQRIALSKDGEVLTQENGSNEWKIFGALNGVRIKTLTRPFLWHSSLLER